MKNVIEYGIQEGEPVLRFYKYRTLDEAKKHLDTRYNQFKEEFEDYKEEDYTLCRTDEDVHEVDLINDCNLLISIVDTTLKADKLEEVV